MVNLETSESILSVNKPRTNLISFSPSATYLIVWEQFYGKLKLSNLFVKLLKTLKIEVNKNESENDVNNLNVYNIQTKQWVKGFQQKNN